MLRKPLSFWFLHINKGRVPHISHIQIMSISTYFVISLTLLWLSTVSALLSASQQSLRGDAIKCPNEGESVKVSLLSDDPCISCKCINKEIICQREVCLNIKDCYLLYYGTNRTCCDVCKGCLYNGQYYKSGEKFHDSNDLCKTFVCNSGVITEYNTYCHIPCDNPLKLSNQCCPSCGKCGIFSENVKEGDLISNAFNSSITDPCIRCECIEGNIVCSKKACPVLSCPQSKWYTPDNQCCPKCKGHRKVHDFEGNCIMGVSAYRDGHSYTYDSCTNCVCNSTTNICERKVCPPLSCLTKHQRIELGECCPKCHQPEEVQTSCSYMGREYKSGDKWNHNNCHMCSCVNGEVRCTAQICSKHLICPKRYKLTRLTGDCCNSCVEEDSVCKITNNLTQFYTFDGKEYEFSGKCNYILSRDCKSRTFSVHIVNKYQNESIVSELRNSSHFTGTSLMVKIENFKVRLGQSGRVTVGRTKVRLPHIRLGILSIVKDSNKVIVRANIGVKVIWESGKAIEIIVPPEFKSKTCGLCGNYNNNPNDDFLTKKGKIYTEVPKFAHSWKVGKNLICETTSLTTKAMKSPLRCSDWEQRYYAINVCNILKSSLFRQCHTSISITPFFGKCLSDVCSCRKTRICHCNAIQSYANQCQRLGFYSQHWKKKTLCEAMKCPSGSTFSTCISACKRTCHNTKKTNNTNDCRKRKCRPGCACPIGQVWHNSKCIYKQLCPKDHNSTQESTETFNENFLKDQSIVKN